MLCYHSNLRDVNKFFDNYRSVSKTTSPLFLYSLKCYLYHVYLNKLKFSHDTSHKHLKCEPNFFIADAMKKSSFKIE
jgi:hypothetical protein